MIKYYLQSRGKDDAMWHDEAVSNCTSVLLEEAKDLRKRGNKVRVMECTFHERDNGVACRKLRLDALTDPSASDGWFTLDK